MELLTEEQLCRASGMRADSATAYLFVHSKYGPQIVRQRYDVMLPTDCN